MMDLESAIKHCEEVAERQERASSFWSKGSKNHKNCLECAKEHRQLATWLRELKQLREQMNSSEKQNKWIPISKDVPIIGQEVLVCDFDGDMYITYLHLNGTWGFDYCGNKIKSVVAWQELPAPFKPQESDDENCDEIWEKAYAERDGKK